MPRPRAHRSRLLGRRTRAALRARRWRTRHRGCAGRGAGDGAACGRSALTGGARGVHGRHRAGRARPVERGLWLFRLERVAPGVRRRRRPQPVPRGTRRRRARGVTAGGTRPRRRDARDPLVDDRARRAELPAAAARCRPAVEHPPRGRAAGGAGVRGGVWIASYVLLWLVVLVLGLTTVALL